MLLLVLMNKLFDSSFVSFEMLLSMALENESLNSLSILLSLESEMELFSLLSSSPSLSASTLASSDRHPK